jgi:hypothetical protein
MKKISLIAILFISINSFGQSKEAEEVNQLHKKKFTWLINKNYDSLNWLMDEQLSYIHSNGWIQTKQEVVDDLKSGKSDYSSVVVEESTVSLYDKCAIAKGKGIYKGFMPDKSEFNVHLLYTEVYVKVKKQWKLVLRQATKI